MNFNELLENAETLVQNISNTLNEVRPAKGEKKPKLSDIIGERIKTLVLQDDIDLEMITELKKQRKQALAEESAAQIATPTQLQTACLELAMQRARDCMNRLQEVIGTRTCVWDFTKFENPDCPRVKEGYTREAWRELKKNNKDEYKTICNKYYKEEGEEE